MQACLHPLIAWLSGRATGPVQLKQRAGTPLEPREGQVTQPWKVLESRFRKQEATLSALSGEPSAPSSLILPEFTSFRFWLAHSATCAHGRNMLTLGTAFHDLPVQMPHKDYTEPWGINSQVQREQTRSSCLILAMVLVSHKIHYPLSRGQRSTSVGRR